MATGLSSRIRSFLRLYFANRMVNKAMAKSQVAIDFGPSSVNLMMADTCNSQCLMCGHDYKSCGSNRHISLKNIEVLYSHLDMGRVVDVIYGGGGEPFMNPELAEIAEYTDKTYPVIQHTVITNLIKGDEKIYRRLIRAGVHFVCSVNAAARETFEAVSGTDFYDQVWANLEMLARIRKEERSKIDISASMIIMRSNIAELPEFIEKVAKIGVRSVKTLYVRVYPDDYRERVGKPSQISQEDSLFYMQEQTNKFIRDAERVAADNGVKFDHEPLFGCGKISGRACSEPWRSLFVNYNGNVYPCPASEILFMRKIESGQYASGNIFEQDVMEFWNNDFWQALRMSNLKAGRADLVPECTCCGNAMCWDGPDSKFSHLLDWSAAQRPTKSCEADVK